MKFTEQRIITKKIKNKERSTNLDSWFLAWLAHFRLEERKSKCRRLKRRNLKGGRSSAKPYVEILGFWKNRECVWGYGCYDYILRAPSFGQGLGFWALQQTMLLCVLLTNVFMGLDIFLASLDLS